MSNLKIQRNYTLDYVKYFCALLIMIIHINPFKVISAQAGDITVNTLPRVAVPFFFIVSGYFYAKKLYGGKKPFKAYMLKLFTVYTVWSAAYALRLILIEVKNGRFALSFLKELLIKYLFFGISEHLWYCLALAVAVVFLTLLHRFRAEKAAPIVAVLLFAVGCATVTYGQAVGKLLPSLAAVFAGEYYYAAFRLVIFGPAFVLLGDWVCRNEAHLTASDKKLTVALIVCAVLHIAEKALNLIRGDHLVINLTLIPLVLVLLLVILKHPGKGTPQFARYAATPPPLHTIPTCC